MKPRPYFFSALLLFLTQTSTAQTTFHFVKNLDTSEFKNIINRNGFSRVFLLADVDVWDRIDSVKVAERSSGQALLCMEGEYKNGLRENVFNGYLIDSSDHSKRYKVWEQHLSNGKLNGEWRTYSLKGVLVSVTNYKDGVPTGIAKRYRADGARVMEEREYINGRSKLIWRKYDDSGRLRQVTPVEDGKSNGIGKYFYKSGAVEQEVHLKDNKPHGIRKFYHENGQLWSEVEYKNGKPWNVLSNYKSNGAACDAGTLRNGNGTIILYKEDGTAKAIRHYTDGKIDKGSE